MGSHSAPYLTEGGLYVQENTFFVISTNCLVIEVETKQEGFLQFQTPTSSIILKYKEWRM